MAKILIDLGKLLENVNKSSKFNYQKIEEFLLFPRKVKKISRISFRTQYKYSHAILDFVLIKNQISLKGSSTIINSPFSPQKKNREQNYENTKIRNKILAKKEKSVLSSRSHPLLARLVSGSRIEFTILISVKKTNETADSS